MGTRQIMTDPVGRNLVLHARRQTHRSSGPPICAGLVAKSEITDSRNDA